MNPALAKAIPYLGYPLAALMFFFWLGLREDLAQQVELCNQQKLESIAQAEKIARETLQAAHERRLTELEGLVLRESKARRVADAARLAAEAGAEDAQETIHRLQLEARNAENPTLEQECLSVDVDPAILDRLRD